MFGLPTGIWKHCIGCEKPFVKLNLNTGKEKPAVSECPVCVNCLVKGNKDPVFWQSVKTKINHESNSRS